MSGAYLEVDIRERLRRRRVRIDARRMADARPRWPRGYAGLQPQSVERIDESFGGKPDH